MNQHHHRKLAAGLLLGALCLVLASCTRNAEPEKTAEKKAEPRFSHNTNGEPVLKVDVETQKRIGLVLQPLVETNFLPEVIAYGTVVDPTPLLLLDGELTALEASVALSKKQLDRALKLFKDTENVSQKSVEAAEAQWQGDEIKLQTARRRLELEWGAAIGRLDPQTRQAQVKQLAQQERFLIRVELPPGTTNKPISAAIELDDDHQQRASILSGATTTDPKTQGRGFLLAVDAREFPFRPGAALRARLKIPGSEKKGALIPRSAIIRQEGRNWIYLQTGPEEFTRRLLSLDALSEMGWMDDNFSASDTAVVTGAEQLLSEELKSRLE